MKSRLLGFIIHLVALTRTFARPMECMPVSAWGPGGRTAPPTDCAQAINNLPPPTPYTVDSQDMSLAETYGDCTIRVTGPSHVSEQTNWGAIHTTALELTMGCQKPSSAGNWVGGVAWAGSMGMTRIELEKPQTMPRRGSSNALSNALSGGSGPGSSGPVRSAPGSQSSGLRRVGSGLFPGAFKNSGRPGSRS